jgi:SAM-dependent methyltransferase
MSETALFEDLLSDDGRDDGPELDAYFDRREFLIRGKLEDEHYWHLHRREVILQTLRQAMPIPGAPLVELGCGAGTVTTYLNEHGYRVDYADVHKEGLELARGRAEARLGKDAAGLRFIRLDVCHQELPGRYRGVFLLDVLEHLPDDQDALRRARAAFDPAERDPVLIFTVPAFPALWSPWDDLEKHKRRYTLATARELAERAGFEVARITYFFFPLFFAAGALKGLRTARDRIKPPPPPSGIGDLTEGRPHPALSASLLKLLAIEKVWLRDHDLPLGTSILCVARPR